METLRFLCNLNSSNSIFAISGLKIHHAFDIPYIFGLYVLDIGIVFAKVKNDKKKLLTYVNFFLWTKLYCLKS